jgi:hypothetical protein
MAEDHKTSERAPHDEPAQSTGDPSAQGADRQETESAKKRGAASLQPDDTLEGEGSPGLSILGGGGHA